MSRVKSLREHPALGDQGLEDTWNAPTVLNKGKGPAFGRGRGTSG